MAARTTATNPGAILIGNPGSIITRLTPLVRFNFVTSMSRAHGDVTSAAARDAAANTRMPLDRLRRTSCSSTKKSKVRTIAGTVALAISTCAFIILLVGQFGHSPGIAHQPWWVYS